MKIRKLRDSLKKITLKKLSKRKKEIRSQSQRYAGIVAIVFSLAVISVSSRLYPDFSWKMNAISEFGYQQKSFFFFNPSLVMLCGLMFIFIADLLKRFGIKLKSLVGYLFWISIGSIVMAALFPDQAYDVIHGISAYMGFTSFTFGLYLFGIKIGKLGHKNASRFSLVLTTLGLIPTFATFYMFVGHAIPEVVYVVMVAIWMIYFTFYDMNEKRFARVFG